MSTVPEKLVQAFKDCGEDFTPTNIVKMKTTPLKRVGIILGLPVKDADRALLVEQIRWKMWNGLIQPLPVDFTPGKRWEYREKVVSKIRALPRCMSVIATDVKQRGNMPWYKREKRLKRIFRQYGYAELYDEEVLYMWREFLDYYAPMYGIPVKRGRIDWSSLSK